MAEGLALFDGPTLHRLAPAPLPRAALVLLCGTVAAPALDAVAGGRAGVPFASVTVSAMPDSGRVVGPLPDGPDGARAVNDRYAAEHPAVLAPSLAHDLLWSGDGHDQYEEATLHAVLAMVHLQVIAASPWIAHLGTELTRRQNSLAVTLANSRHPGSAAMTVRADDGPGTIPGGDPSMQTPDFWSIPFAGGPVTDRPAPTSARRGPRGLRRRPPGRALPAALRPGARWFPGERSRQGLAGPGRAAARGDHPRPGLGRRRGRRQRPRDRRRGARLRPRRGPGLLAGVTTADAALSPAGARRAWWVLGAMCLPLLAQSLDVSGIGLLLPSIGADLDAGPTALGWVMNANPLAFGALLLTAGWVADRFGPRALLLTGVGAFGVASALCAVAPSTGFLIAARATQGLASAACFTTSLAVVSATFDERRRPGAIGAWGAVSGAGSAFGPLLAGALAATLGWRWFFVINAPLCLLAVPVIAVLTRPAAATPADPVALPRHGRRDTSTRTGTGIGPTNGLGLAAVAVGFVALSLAVGSSVPPAARLVPALLAAAALAVLWHGRRAGRPVVDPAALAGPWSRAALAVGFSSTWAFGVVLVIGSAMLQQVRGMGPMAAGTTFLAFSGAFALAGAAVGRMVRRAGVGTTMGAGMALTVVGAGAAGPAPVRRRPRGDPGGPGRRRPRPGPGVRRVDHRVAGGGARRLDRRGHRLGADPPAARLGARRGRVGRASWPPPRPGPPRPRSPTSSAWRSPSPRSWRCSAAPPWPPSGRGATTPPRRVGSLHAVLLPEPDDARLALAAVLGAFRSLELQPVQRDVLRDVAATVYGLDIDAEPIEPLAPEQVMAAGATIELRQQAVHLMVVLELIADPVPPDQAPRSSTTPTPSASTRRCSTTPATSPTTTSPSCTPTSSGRAGTPRSPSRSRCTAKCSSSPARSSPTAAPSPTRRSPGSGRASATCPRAAGAAAWPTSTPATASRSPASATASTRSGPVTTSSTCSPTTRPRPRASSTCSPSSPPACPTRRAWCCWRSPSACSRTGPSTTSPARP